MVGILITSFLWWGLTAKNLTKAIENTQIKLAAMCVAKYISESTCYDAINEITNLKFKLAIIKYPDKKMIANELQSFIDKYGIK